MLIMSSILGFSAFGLYICDGDFVLMVILYLIDDGGVFDFGFVFD